MALPQQVVDRLARETPKTPGWSAELLAFSVAMFVISVVIYGGIAFGYHPYTASQIQKLNNQIELFKQQVPAGDQQKIASFYSQLINLRTVLGSRGSVSPFFPWVEAHTDPNVYFNTFTLDVQHDQLALTGIAKSADDAAMQARIFEQDPDVANVLVGNIAQGGTSGLWQFTMTLTFTPSFFQTPPAAVSTPPPLSTSSPTQ